MYCVELYAAVRLADVGEGLSHREAGRRFGIDARTVKKMLSYSAPPGYRRSKAGSATEAGRLHRHHRRDPGGGQGPGGSAQAAAHGASDLRAAAGRARVHGRLHDPDRVEKKNYEMVVGKMIEICDGCLFNSYISRGVVESTMELGWELDMVGRVRFVVIVTFGC